MMAYLLQVTFCLAFFYGFYFIALRKETMFDTNRMYLLVTLAISLILPLIKIYIDHQNAQASRMLPSYVYVGSYITDFSSSISAPATKSFPWGKVIVGVYITGVALMSFRLFLALKQILEIRRNGTQIILSGHRCIISDQVKSPFSFFNSIFLPKDHPFGEEELNEVIAHELAHVRAHHTWDVILMELACIKLWPSPMIFLYRKSLKEVHEYVADAAVLKDTPWEHYAQLLVSQQHSQLQNILSNQLIYSQLKKRLLMMNQERSAAAARYKYLGLIPVLLLALVLFSFREKPSGNEIPGAYIGDPMNTEKNTLFDTDDHLYYANFDSTQTLPVFPGCDDVDISVREKCGMAKLQEYVSNNMTYPESLQKEGIEGRVVVKFVVDAEGYVKDAVIQESLQQDADKVVLDIVNGMNVKVGKWRPARKEGKSYDAEMHLPVKFALDQNIPKAEPLKQVDVPARFPGCEHITDAAERNNCAQEKMIKFVYSKVLYPKEDREKGIEGIGVVQFVITSEGILKDIQVLRSPSPGITAELERLMNLMAAIPEKWTPAQKAGKTVDYQLMLPVKFKLQDDESGRESTTSSSSASELAPKSISVVPNPASEKIIVSIFKDTHTLKVYDSTGKLLITQEVPSSSAINETINISALKNGQYVVQVLSDKESLSAAFAVVK